MLDQHATPKTNAQCLLNKISVLVFQHFIKMIKAAFNGLNSTKTDMEQLVVADEAMTSAFYQDCQPISLLALTQEQLGYEAGQ